MKAVYIQQHHFHCNKLFIYIVLIIFKICHDPVIKDLLLLVISESINRCNNEEFHCDNGICIPNKYLCDVDDDCGDMSDEKKSQCKMIEIRVRFTKNLTTNRKHTVE